MGSDSSCKTALPTVMSLKPATILRLAGPFVPQRFTIHGFAADRPAPPVPAFVACDSPMHSPGIGELEA
jgi:hypothetical protein